MTATGLHYICLTDNAKLSLLVYSLRTRIAYVQGKESGLEEKRQHCGSIHLHSFRLQLLVIISSLHEAHLCSFLMMYLVYQM